MTKHVIPRRDVCHYEEMQKLGERIRIRMCPNKPLEFELEVTP